MLDRASKPVAQPPIQVQTLTSENVSLAYVDQEYTGDEPVAAAHAQGIHLEVVKLPEAKHGFVLVPRC